MDISLCPDRKVLLAYRIGELSEADAAPITDHVSVCPTCQAALGTFSEAEDTLVARLRQPAEADPYANEPEEAQFLARAVQLVGAVPGDPAAAQAPAEQAPAAVASGTEPSDLGQLGEYQLLAKVGEGGMGAVYKARQVRLDKIVALKILPKDRTADAAALARFDREMKAVGRLDHANIVRAMDAREIDGTTVLVMEYVDGTDLGRLVHNLGPLPVADACELVRQAALGLQYAHQHGLVHRDIKLSNLMLTCGERDPAAKTVSGPLPLPQVKILDLGLALLGGEQAAGGSGGELTSGGQAMGTADYMAPEQVSDAHSVDIRADIYSLGCTLYKLLTGHAPFSGPQYRTQVQKLLAHLQEEVPPIGGRRSDVPEPLAAVIGRMLAKKPAERYATPAEAATAVAPFAAGCDLARLLAEDALGLGSARGANATADTQPYAPSAHSGTPTPLAVPGSTTVHARAARRRVRWAVAVALGFAGVLLFGAVMILTTRHGTLVIESDDPDVRVAVKQGGELVEVVDAKSGWKISLKSGQYELAPQGSKDKFELDQNSVTVRRGDVVKVKLTKSEISTLKSPLPAIGGLIGPDGKWKLPAGAPPPAVAPFDAKKAKELQEAWAKHLGVPVEMTNSVGMKLVLIPPGEFMMGSPKEVIEEQLKAHADDPWFVDFLKSEAPLHRVRITKPFYLGMYVVTQDEFQRIMGYNPSSFSVNGNGRDAVAGQDTKRFPVEQVSWTEAAEFCRKLSAMPEEKVAGRTYRLPSQAQREYACRAGSTGRYSISSGGNAIAKESEEQELFNYGWFLNNSTGRTHAVGGKRASAWGLYDMHGNVFQWCQDWYDKDYYAKSPVNDPTGPLGGETRVLCGGSGWHPADVSRSTVRIAEEPGFHNLDGGFRVSLVLPDKPAEQAAVPIEPIVPVKPVRLDLKPDVKAWDLQTGSPLNPASLVLKPAAIKGLRSWTLETCAVRDRSGPDAGAGQLSADDQLYATGGHDGVIRFLDPATGKLRIALVNPEPDLTALTWSPENMYVAVGCANGVVRIWNVAKGTIVIGPRSSSTNRISSLAWSPDGTLLAIARWGEPAVVLWDVREARQSAILEEQSDVNRSVTFLAWSADGKQLMSTTDLAVRVWDVAGARLIQTLDPQTPQDQAERHAAAWSPDGKRIATLCGNLKVKFFDSTYKLVMSRDVGALREGRYALAWSPDGCHLAASCYDGCAVLNTASGLREFVIGGMSRALSWSKDRAQLLSTHFDGTVVAMDAHSGKPLWQLAAPCNNGSACICISPDGRQYATAGCSVDRLYTWDAMQSAFVHDYGPIFPGYHQVVWSTDGRLAVASGWIWSGDTGGRIWDPGEPRDAHLYRDGGGRCAAWSPDGKTLARGGWDDVFLHTSDSEDPHQVFHDGAKVEVARLAWATNNSTLAAGLSNNKVVILEMPSGKVLRTLERVGLDGGICYLTVLPDGLLVAASGNGAVSVWNSKWETVGDLFRLKKTVHRGRDIGREEINVNDGTIPAAGTTIAFATSDGIVLWDADKQAVQRKVGTGPMYSVAWSLPLHRLIAAQEDRIVIYDEPTGTLLASQVIWYGPGKHLFLSPEGHVRCSPAMSEDVVYVALTDEGRQVTLRPAEFAAAYGWKNDPAKVLPKTEGGN